MPAEGHCGVPDYLISGYLIVGCPRGRWLDKLSDVGRSEEAQTCQSCEGRGWLVVAARRAVDGAEGGRRLKRRACLDCGGCGWLAVPGVHHVWASEDRVG